jgi:hypothetical protein
LRNAEMKNAMKRLWSKKSSSIVSGLYHSWKRKLGIFITLQREQFYRWHLSFLLLISFAYLDTY